VLRGFLFSEDNPLAPGQHRGIDIEGGLGDAVLAPVPGKVTFVGRVAANGLTVTIETSDGYTVTLLHLGGSLVAPGTLVAEAQPIATVGTSGVPEYSVPYVQLGVRLTSDPEGYRDPQGFLPPLAPPSLPPTPVGDHQPAAAAPLSPATPASAAAASDREAPRPTGHVPTAPNRPAAQPELSNPATPTRRASTAAVGSATTHVRTTAVDSTGTTAAPALHPTDARLSRKAAVSADQAALRQSTFHLR